jgi:P27 family predicted phage terminase small subunit
VARGEWDRVVAELSASYLITPLDQSTLAVYCETFAQWRDAKAQLETQGFTVPTKEGVKANPLMKIVQGLVCEIRRMSAEFGFSPASRSRIDVNRPETVEEDEFETM